MRALYSIPMLFVPKLSPVQKEWLHAHAYEVENLLAKGKSAGVWIVKKNGKHFAAKCEHEKSPRRQMLEREVLQLQMANALGIGPQFFEASLEARIIIMELVRGKTFRDFVRACTDKKILQRAVEELFAQAMKLDAAGIDHGQLGGKLVNILVSSHNRIFIIDFEKASYVRKARNVVQLKHALFNGKTDISKKIITFIEKPA